MSSETALLAYVFLGNALNAVLKGVAIDFEEDLGVPRSSCEALCLAVEPLTPRDVLTVIAGLNDDQRVLLVRVGRWCLNRLGTDFEPQMGVNREEAEAVLQAVSAGRLTGPPSDFAHGG